MATPAMLKIARATIISTSDQPFRDLERGLIDIILDAIFSDISAQDALAIDILSSPLQSNRELAHVSAVAGTLGIVAHRNPAIVWSALVPCCRLLVVEIR